jgi:hypothetical protein
VRVANTLATLADIGFDSNGDLDQTALFAHTGTNVLSNGYSDIWYDQSGNNFHLSAPATGNRPQIVNGGNLVTNNSKVTINFNGSTNYLLYTGNVVDQNKAKSIFHVLRYPSNNWAQIATFGNKVGGEQFFSYGMINISGSTFVYSDGVNGANNAAIQNYSLGFRSDNTLYFSNRMAEALVFDSVLNSTNITKISENEKNYFSLP